MDASRVRLLVGVLSFNNTGLRARRDALRAIISSPADGVSVVFAIPADQPDTDKDASDVLRLQMPAGTCSIACILHCLHLPSILSCAHNRAVRRSKLGKYFLQNAFFRWAVQQPFDYLARADDDAAFNATAIATYLGVFRASHAEAQYVVYGPQQDWYMWHTEAMTAACHATSSYRWELTWLRSQTQPSKYRGHECLRSGTEGPFPFVAGPFVAYSKPLATILATHRDTTARSWHWQDAPAQLDKDEIYVRSNRSTRPMLNAFTGVVVPLNASGHPHNRVFFEEVYYAALVHRILKEKRVWILHAWMSQYSGGTRRRRVDPPPTIGSTLFAAHIYHNLKRPSRMQFVLNNSATFLRTLTLPGFRCRNLIMNRASLPKSEVNVSASLVAPPLCCESWQRCLPCKPSRRRPGDCVQAQ